MKHLSSEGFTSLSQEELQTVEGGGFLTSLTQQLATQITGVVAVVQDVTAATGAFLKAIVGIIV